MVTTSCTQCGPGPTCMGYIEDCARELVRREREATTPADRAIAQIEQKFCELRTMADIRDRLLGC